MVRKGVKYFSALGHRSQILRGMAFDVENEPINAFCLFLLYSYELEFNLISIVHVDSISASKGWILWIKNCDCIFTYYLASVFNSWGIISSKYFYTIFDLDSWASSSLRVLFAEVIPVIYLNLIWERWYFPETAQRTETLWTTSSIVASCQPSLCFATNWKTGNIPR